MIRTNMTEFPAGLMEPLPPSVSDIEISTSNLTKLPSDFHERWHALSLLYFEHCELTELPQTIFQIPTIVLSVVGNKIRYLPSLEDVSKFYYMMDFGENPLKELPATINNDTHITYLNIEKTDVERVPAWVSTNVYLPFGSGSPYCQDKWQDTKSNVVLGCIVSDPRGGGRIPISIIDYNMKLFGKI